MKELMRELKKIESNPKKWRQFGLLVGGILVLLGGVVWMRGGSSGAFGVGAALFAGGFLVPAILRPLYLLWMAFGVVAGALMSRVVLAITFFFLMAPIGALLRLAGKDLLGLRIESGRRSYWVKREPSGGVARLEKQF